MCRHIYDWNIVNGDVKQPIHHHLTFFLPQNSKFRAYLAWNYSLYLSKDKELSLCKIVWILQIYSNFPRLLHIILLFHPKTANFEINQLVIIADIFIKVMNYHCAKFNTNASSNMDTIKLFQFLAMFEQNFTVLTQIPDCGPIQLGIIAHISFKVINYHSAKFNALIKKWTMKPFFDNNPLAIKNRVVAAYERLRL